jgi:hypothetical protein
VSTLTLAIALYNIEQVRQDKFHLLDMRKPGASEAMHMLITRSRHATFCNRSTGY